MKWQEKMSILDKVIELDEEIAKVTIDDSLISKEAYDKSHENLEIWKSEMLKKEELELQEKIEEIDREKEEELDRIKLHFEEEAVNLKNNYSSKHDVLIEEIKRIFLGEISG